MEVTRKGTTYQGKLRKMRPYGLLDRIDLHSHLQPILWGDTHVQQVHTWVGTILQTYIVWNPGIP